MVLGQPDFTSFVGNNGGVSGSSLKWPNSVYSDGTRIAVGDSDNNRVLIWNTVPTVAGQAADVVLGQPNMTSNTANNGGSANPMNTAWGVCGAGTKLAAVDSRNHRVQIWNSWPSSDSTAADIILTAGMFYPAGCSTDGTRFAVADFYNSRVLLWNTFPTVSNQPPDVIVGGAGTISANKLAYPWDVSVTSDGLFVADSSNKRILGWKGAVTAAGTNADVVFGQPNFTTTGMPDIPLDETRVNFVTGVFFDGVHLWWADQYYHRVVRKKVTLPSGP